MTGLRNYHAPVWDEPLIVEMGAPGRRGAVPPAPIDGATAPEVPAALRRSAPPALPEIAEPDVLRHACIDRAETTGHHNHVIAPEQFAVLQAFARCFIGLAVHRISSRHSAHPFSP